MANNYYTRQHDYLPLSIARGDSVQEDFQSVEVGFDKLPHPRVSGRGFGEAVVVGEGSDPNHALTKGQVQAIFDDKVLAAASYAGPWASLTGPLETPATVSHHNMLWFLLEPVANIAAHEPGVSAVWLALNDQRFDLYTQLEVDYDGDGRISELEETFFFGVRTTTYTYDANGLPETVVVEAHNARRTETYHYDGSGAFSHITATIEAIV